MSLTFFQSNWWYKQKRAMDQYSKIKCKKCPPRAKSKDSAHLSEELRGRQDRGGPEKTGGREPGGAVEEREQTRSRSRSDQVLTTLHSSHLCLHWKSKYHLLQRGDKELLCVIVLSCVQAKILSDRNIHLIIIQVPFTNFSATTYRCNLLGRLGRIMT